MFHVSLRWSGDCEGRTSHEWTPRGGRLGPRPRGAPRSRWCGQRGSAITFNPNCKHFYSFLGPDIDCCHAPAGAAGAGRALALPSRGASPLPRPPRPSPLTPHPPPCTRPVHRLLKPPFATPRPPKTAHSRTRTASLAGVCRALARRGGRRQGGGEGGAPRAGGAGGGLERGWRVEEEGVGRRGGRAGEHPPRWLVLSQPLLRFSRRPLASVSCFGRVLLPPQPGETVAFHRRGDAGWPCRLALPAGPADPAGPAGWPCRSGPHPETTMTLWRPDTGGDGLRSRCHGAARGRGRGGTWRRAATTWWATTRCAPLDCEARS